MSEILTRPEHATERAIARRILARVNAAGGCRYCKHAVHAPGWSVSACSTSGRSFPLCLKTGGVEFELDEEQLQGDSHGDTASK